MVLMTGKCNARTMTAQYHFRVIFNSSGSIPTVWGTGFRGLHGIHCFDFGLTPVPEDHVYRFDPGLDMEFLVDVIDVLADGFGTDE